MLCLSKSAVFVLFVFSISILNAQPSFAQWCPLGFAMIDGPYGKTCMKVGENSSTNFHGTSQNNRDGRIYEDSGKQPTHNYSGSSTSKPNDCTIFDESAWTPRCRPSTYR